MFTRKLVEKNVEVRVVQKRVITMYDYEDEELDKPHEDDDDAVNVSRAFIGREDEQ